MISNCPKCNNSNITPLSTVSWQIPWEPQRGENPGTVHWHNPNKEFHDFQCENGHIFETTTFPKCWCGWQATNA